MSMSARAARGSPLGSPAPTRLCRTCLLRRLAANRQQHRRPIHLSTLAKRRAAEEAWQLRASKIKTGEEPHLWDMFKARGYVKDIAGKENQIRELMRRKRIGVYVGIDPTAASLHLGHLLPLMPLFWMYMHGYRAVSVIGGATAKVGDPTGRLTTREDVSKVDRTRFITKLHYQVKRIWQHVDNQAAHYGYQKEWAWNRELVNNTAWHNSTSFAEVVHRLYTRMRVGPMLARETAKRKMTEGDGMSLAEFVYPTMQAWDWWKMFSGPKDVCMQIGGSDQYGNIVAGVEAVKLLRDSEPDPQRKRSDTLLDTPVGFTVPLLTDAAGNKFGKSAGNAMWLDPFMTSTFDLYGYFMRRPDADVERLLKLFTFLPLEQIDEVMAQHNLDPPKRHAHHTLALEVLALVHGRQEAEATQARHRQMFASRTESMQVTTDPLSTGEVEQYPGHATPASAQLATNFRPDIKLPESLIMGESISRILWAAGLADSASDAHRLVAHQGAYVGGAPGRSAATNKEMSSGEVTFQSVKTWFPADTKNFLIGGKILILRRGKHFVRIIEMISDEEWDASGNSYPGERNKGRVRMLIAKLRALGAGFGPKKFSRNEISRVRKKIAEMEHQINSAPEDADPAQPPKIVFPLGGNRSRMLLDDYARNYDKMTPKVESWVRWKMTAIDEVLADARQVLEEKKKGPNEGSPVGAALERAFTSAQEVPDEKEQDSDEASADTAASDEAFENGQEVREEKKKGPDEASATTL
ncbi:tyrosyl-tRNA synthetase [Nemania serpens]|nr:tyrosyl-tRNA synthetase [Nemania serpens]